MWGNILTEVSYIQNFNMGFTNNKSDVLIHLTQWQYWWWFWFTFLWAMYYLLIARIFRYRTLKFSPRIVSSLRPHGKWGDLLACIIPTTWCINILLNSNFILKLIEWQSESSLFTLRVRAKQWYWVYKLDLRNISDIVSTPRNIGRNKWQFSTFGDLQTAEDYLHILQMRAYNNWSKDFWSDLGKKSLKRNGFSVNSPLTTYKEEFLENAKTTFLQNTLGKSNLYVMLSNTDKNVHMFNNDIIPNNTLTLINTYIKFNKSVFTATAELEFGKNKLFNNTGDRFYRNTFFKKTQITTNNKKLPDVNKSDSSVSTWDSPVNNNVVTFLKKDLFGAFTKQKSNINHPDLDDETRILKKNAGKNTPLRVLKLPKNDFFFSNTNTEKTELLRFRFNDKNPTIANKPIKNTVYLTFKQKRYNQRVNISTKNTTYLCTDTQKTKKYSGNPFLKDLSIIDENFGTPTRQYRMVKKAKSRLDTTKVGTWNRLLRSRRVLVLPAHVNITVITNSFDVVHSWHIPGLGLKMDCLPGRATHHTLYIDNVGLYYGQCAEICGRYHHHMPIRICALPFEHFLVWWHTFGLPKFLFPSNKNKSDVLLNKYLSRKFSW